MGKTTLDTPDEYLNFPKTIVLVGKTGNGKSATANSIVGDEVFESETSFSGVTATCQMHATVLPNGHILNVIDTPGLFDSSMDPKSIGDEIAKCIKMAKTGIHAVLVVARLGVRFSMEEASAIESFRRFFGEKLGDYMIMVFTHGDCLRKVSFDEFMSRNTSEPLAKTLEMCGNRHVVFDNWTEDEFKKSEQLMQLVGLVGSVVHNNGGVPYTDELFVDESESENGMNGILEKVELKLRETTLMMEKQLAEERLARVEAESKAKEAQIKSMHEMSELKSDLERARREAEELKKTQAETEHKFKASEGKLKETEGKFKRSEGKLKETEDKFKRTEGKLKETEDKFKRSEGKLKDTEDKFKRTEGKLRHTEHALNHKVGCVIS